MNWTTWYRHLYALWAPFYDVLVSVLEDKRRQSLKLANIQENESILILGAGTGLDLPYLPRASRPKAVDICPAMMKRLTSRAERLGMDVDAQIMDGQNLLYEDETFDVVILHFVLAVIPDPQKAVQEAIRVTKPGGRLVILNKFLDDDRKPSVALKAANAVARLVATDITFKLRPILETPGLETRHVERLGIGGFFKLAILEKTSNYTKPLVQESFAPAESIQVELDESPEMDTADQAALSTAQ